ncbi:MAG: RNA-directed DNA polymerase [Candidatus Electrothrix sp. GW3-4]|uniref:RNA-directed DNA polymerase n=1 Tax=Candidatus Electrothrix sp. GW3-4 TaxID=3126740 RepID=UPI0030CBCD62
MKRASRLLERIAEPDNLRLAFWKARKGKSLSTQMQAYQNRLEHNLLLLRGQILSGKISIGAYSCFAIHDPKKRRICAAPFTEQVLHHALMNVCHYHFETKQIYDSYASRPGKGTHAAVRRTQMFSGASSWFLKLDVRKFFASIHHGCLKEQLRRMFKDHHLLGLLDTIIDSYEDSPGRGLPIGNLSSQYFANHYLAGLDHFIKEQLRCRAYIRYMDDMVLWHNDKKRLKEWHHQIREFVRNRLQCELKPILLNRTEHGVPFLGYRIFPFHIRLLQRSKARFIRKMRYIERKYQSGAWSEQNCQRHALPLIAFTALANAEVFRRDVMQRLQNDRASDVEKGDGSLS